VKTFFILFFTPLVVLAQLRAFECDKKMDIEAGEKLLQRSQDIYSNLSSLTGEFDQESYMAALDLSEVSYGQMWFERPGKMKWEYKYPEKQEFILKENSFWFYQPRLNQVIVDSVKNAFVSDLPVSFLLGVGDMVSQFKVLSVCSSKEGTVLGLGKRATDENLKEFFLLVDSYSGVPRGAKVIDVGGNITTIVIRSPSLNQKLPKGLFVTEFPGKPDIDDRRGVL
jgi:outer membrane lipoprotein carrier protein